MSSAIFGLVGVLLGGVITYIGQLRLDQRRADREVAADEQRRVAEEQVAARLVLAELMNTQAYLRAAAEREQIPGPLRLPDSAWREHGSVLSRAMNDNAWRQLAGAYSTVSGWEAIATLKTRSPLRGLMVAAHAQTEASFATEAHEAVLSAIEVLEPIALPVEQPGLAARLAAS